MTYRQGFDEEAFTYSFPHYAIKHEDYIGFLHYVGEVFDLPV